MACAPGCTDCPTCRGEVQPDAPVMKDIAFAMAMAGGLWMSDRLLGPLSVAQTVRDSGRLRGAPTLEDQAVQRFLDGLNKESVTGAGAQPLPPPQGAQAAHEPPWGTPGLSGLAADGRMGWGKFLARELRAPSATPAHPSPWRGPYDGPPVLAGVAGRSLSGDLPMPWDPEDPYTREQLDRLNELPVLTRRGKLKLRGPLSAELPKKRTPPPGSIDLAPRCCVKRFDYPTFYCTTALSMRDGRTHLQVLFESEAEFEQGARSTTQGAADGTPPPITDGDTDAGVVNCNCSCCAFRQFVNADLERPGREKMSTNGRFAEDCVNTDEKDFRTERAVPYDGPPSNPEHPVHCYGERGEKHDDSKYHHGDRENPGESRTACDYWMRDRPGFRVDPLWPDGGLYKFKGTFLGRIVDTCHDERPVVSKAFAVDWSFNLSAADDTIAKQRTAAGQATVTQVTADGDAAAGQPRKKADGECA